MSTERVTHIAIVTGAGSGIGRAVALGLANKGFTVALVGRTRERLEAVLGDIQRMGHGLVVPADVSKLPEVSAMVQTVMDHFRRVDVLINCAGLAPNVTLAAISPEQWHDVLDANLSATFYTTRTVWPHMAKQEMSGMLKARGVIVNISSMASKDPFPGLGAYAVAKAGVNMLTLVMGREGRAAGIRAVCIAPAAVDTPMFHQLMGERPIADDVMLAPEDVAGMVLEAVSGSLCHCSGDTLFVHRRPA